MEKIKRSKLAYFVFFLALVFAVYRPLFNSYFEADEWFHFTHSMPLTRQPNGLWLTLSQTITNSSNLSAGQHIDPIGEMIFYLNSLFFGTSFTPYVIASLLLHALNSFLVFLLIKEFYSNRDNLRVNLLTLSGGAFFALLAAPYQNVTWVAFYGQNVLSATFFLLTLLFLKKGFNLRSKTFISLSSLFLLLSLLTKESAFSLLFIIPLIIFTEDKVFSTTYLFITYLIPLVLYLPYRFLLPAFYNLKSPSSQSILTINDTTNLVIFRTFTFPFRMISEVFLPRGTVLSILTLIMPAIYPQIGEEGEFRRLNRLHYLYGPGDAMIVYLFSLIIIILVIVFLVRMKRSKHINESIALLTGLGIIIATALPLVLNVLFIPTWGIDFFDSRDYYLPAIGAAILFSYFLFKLGEFLSKLFVDKRFNYSPKYMWIIILFGLWLAQNTSALNKQVNGVAQLGAPRKYIIESIKRDIPVLPPKAVFYTESNKELSPDKQQPILPFQTSFAQVLTIVYYDKNPLPDSFFNETFLGDKGLGYEFKDGRGLGYYRSKTDLLSDIKIGKFDVSDVYAFYYNPDKNVIENITASVRQELESSISGALR